jgi:hypothetical protein
VDSSLWAHPPLDEELQSLTIWPECVILAALLGRLSDRADAQD